MHVHRAGAGGRAGLGWGHGVSCGEEGNQLGNVGTGGSVTGVAG